MQLSVQRLFLPLSSKKAGTTRNKSGNPQWRTSETSLAGGAFFSAQSQEHSCDWALLLPPVRWGTELHSYLLGHLQEQIVQLLSHFQLCYPMVLACQASLSITNTHSLLKFMCIELGMLFNHLILCCPFFFCLQSFPASGFFPMSRLYASGGQSTGASLLVLPMNIQS